MTACSMIGSKTIDDVGYIEPPIKPILAIETRDVNKGGGVCLNRDNLIKLNQYIIELESLYIQ